MCFSLKTLMSILRLGGADTPGNSVMIFFISNDLTQMVNFLIGSLTVIFGPVLLSLPLPSDSSFHSNVVLLRLPNSDHCIALVSTITCFQK